MKAQTAKERCRDALIIEIDDVVGIRGLKELVAAWHIPPTIATVVGSIMTQHPYQRISFVVRLALVLCIRTAYKLYKNVSRLIARKRWIDRMWN